MSHANINARSSHTSHNNVSKRIRISHLSQNVVIAVLKVVNWGNVIGFCIVPHYWTQSHLFIVLILLKCIPVFQPSEFVSTGNHMYVQFVTNDAISSTGFRGLVAATTRKLSPPVICSNLPWSVRTTDERQVVTTIRCLWTSQYAEICIFPATSL